ncbi:hypothetical protein ACLS0F_01325 [Avibacterium endocarditidis]|uniref:hypothetical protein n=1 Tax=Avibacterium endocarditidis TaxID=380674 RepID=UPI0015E253A4|nr:hypothetical protein [Avibacterium endocarditidis]
MRQSRYAEAISFCANCTPNQYSENELANLARAYRNEKQFKQSLKFGAVVD